MARRRARWKRHQGKLDPTRLVFIDETWAKTNMTRTHGRCSKGRRLVAKVPRGRWRTLTFLAALRCDRIDAPCVIDGPINGTSFLAYVEQVLVPTLKPGDLVRIVPNHACVVSNMVDDAWLVSGGAPLERLDISARGRIQ